MTNPGNTTNSELNDAQAALKNGAYKKAEQILIRILNAVPAQTDALALLGLSYAQQGRLSEAVPVLEQAASLQPDDPAINNNLALVLELSGHIDRAIHIYRRLINDRPDNIEALSNLGDALRKIGQLDEASIFLENVLKINPTHLATLNSLGIVFQEQGNFDKAESTLRYALTIVPDSPHILSNLAGVLHKQDRYAESIELLEQIVDRKPDYQSAWANLSAAYTMIRQYNKAEKAALKAIDLNPGASAAWVNLGKLNYETGNFDESLNNFNRAIQLDSNNLEARWQKGFTSLILGDYASGWKDYDIGLLCGGRSIRKVNLPQWQGEELKAKTILVLAEQGLGDEIMFASCLPDLQQLGGKIIYECDQRLAPLFQRSFPDVQFFSRLDSAKKISNYQIDLKIASGSLPGIFRKHIDNFPSRKSFLLPDPDKIESWKLRYASLGSGLKIGISWRGGNRIDPLRRSIELDQWLPILEMKEHIFIDIQYGDSEAERQHIQSSHGIKLHHFVETLPTTEQDNFAAQIAALDLVISVSNATVHLAGAIGTPAWSLLPVSPNWRWGLNTKTTNWYPSVELIRQSRADNWSNTLLEIQQKLMELSHTR